MAEGKTPVVTFERAATFDGPAYAAARGALAGQGRAIVPLAEQEAKSADWRHWSLAQTLLLKINEPEKEARWRRAIVDYRSRLESRRDGTLVARIGEGKVGDEEVPIDREAVPILIDALREHAEAASRGWDSKAGICDRALTALAHFVDPRTAEPLVEFAPLLGPLEDKVVDALVRIGRPALPAIHKAAVYEGDAPYIVQRRANVAALAIGRIGDRSSAAVVVGMLDRLDLAESIPIFCRAVRTTGAPDGPELVFRQLLKIADSGLTWESRRSDCRHYYGQVRAELLAFGAADAALKNHQADDKPPRTRAIAQGVAFELHHAEELNTLYEQVGGNILASRRRPALAGGERKHDLAALGRECVWTGNWERLVGPSAGVPAPLVVELAAVWPDEQPRLRALGRLAGNRLAVELLTWVLVESPESGFCQDGAVLALAEAGGTKAIDVYRRRLEKHPTVDVGPVIEGLARVADPQGAAVLEDIIARDGTSINFSEPPYRADAALARRILPLLKEGPEKLTELLDAELPSLRLAVARGLAARGNLRAVPVLFEVAAATPAADLAAEERSASVSHREARDALVALGKPALAAIRESATRSKARFARLLAETLALRIEKPELAVAFTRAALIVPFDHWHHIGPSVAGYQAAGVQMAKLLGAEAVPLLEAALVWQSDGTSPGVAAFALAKLGQERSIEVLVARAATIGQARGSSLAAAALRDFGPKGIEAAAKVPAPDPAREEFGGRVGRHRAVTEALVLADDAKGLDGILAGLKLAAEGQIEPSRTTTYLRLAVKYTDPRLVPATIAAFEKQGTDRGMLRAATEVLAHYPDPRIVPVCLQALEENDSGREAALAGIARVKGPQTVDFLFAKLDESKDARVRTAILEALARLASNATLAPQNAVVAAIGQETVRQSAPKVRAALLRTVREADGALQAAAAETLAWYCYQKNDDEAVAVLLAWLPHGPWEPGYPGQVIGYLISTRDPRVGPVLHELYRQKPLERGILAYHLATLRYEKAAGDIAATLESRLDKPEPRWNLDYEINALVDLGLPGRKALLAITEKHRDPGFRAEALAALTSGRYQAASQPAAKLLAELAARDPAVQPAAPKSDKARERLHHAVFLLARALLAADRTWAEPLVTQACLDARDPEVRALLAEELRER